MCKRENCNFFRAAEFQRLKDTCHSKPMSWKSVQRFLSLKTDFFLLLQLQLLKLFNNSWKNPFLTGNYVYCISDNLWNQWIWIHISKMTGAPVQRTRIEIDWTRIIRCKNPDLTILRTHIHLIRIRKFFSGSAPLVFKWFLCANYGVKKQKLKRLLNLFVA